MLKDYKHLFLYITNIINSDCKNIKMLVIFWIVWAWIFIWVKKLGRNASCSTSHPASNPTSRSAVGEVSLQVCLEHRDVQAGVAVALHHRAEHASDPGARTWLLDSSSCKTWRSVQTQIWSVRELIKLFCRVIDAFVDRDCRDFPFQILLLNWDGCRRHSWSPCHKRRST